MSPTTAASRKTTPAKPAPATRPTSRAQVVSSFTIVKGAMIAETHAVFAAWDFAQSKRANLDRLRADNLKTQGKVDPDA